MSQGKAPATELPKKMEPARQLEQGSAHQPEQGPVQLVAPWAAYRRAQVNGLRPVDLLALQRSVGNRQVQRIVEWRDHGISASNGAVGAQNVHYPGPDSTKTEVGLAASMIAREPDPTQAEPDPNRPVLDEYKGKNVNKIGHISAPASQYKAASTTGVNVRARPNGALQPIAQVVYDTEVQVQALDKTDAFYFIIANTGAIGWLNKDFVALDPPDIKAHLHHITESNLTTILKNEYIDKNLWTLSTGNDYTTLAAAVVAANTGRKGVYVDWTKAKEYKEEHPFKRWLDPWMIDNFAIYHGSTILAGHNIWLPSPAYVRMLQQSGVIGSRPDWVNFAVDVGQGIAGFFAGVVSGVFGSLWDTLTGLWELAKGIVDTIRSVLDGSLFAALESIYDTVTNMTWEDFKNLVDEIITMGKNAFNDFMKNWTHPDTYKRWHFRGYVIGAVALEVILAIFTAGGALAAKVLAKIGKYFPKLMRVLTELLRLADKLPDLPGRRKHDIDKPGKQKHPDRDKHDGDKDDKDLSPDDRSWEQARVMAAVVTEQHDLQDTPVETLIPLLNSTIAAHYKVVSGYKAVPLAQPNAYKIIQTARRRDVDDHYTEKKPKAPKFEFFRTLYGKSADQVWDRASKVGWKADTKLRTGKGWVFRDENGIERFRFRRDKSGTWLHEKTGYVRWTDEKGNFLDINGKAANVGGTPINVSMSQRHIRDVVCNGNAAEFDRVMRETHISVAHLGGEW